MKFRRLPTTRVILLGFLISALLGGLLLFCPFCLKNGVTIGFTDALFTSVSGVCVTGLTTVNIGATFSFAGQLILLLLIQMGGLGVVTFTTLGLMLFHRKITLADRMLIQNAYNLDTLSGLVKLTVKITKVTLLIEGVGAVVSAAVFVPRYGIIGIWYGIFHAVSAFCNAGMDVLGGNSLCAFRDCVLLNAVTEALIIAGGLGFPVYWELGRLVRQKKVFSGEKMNYHTRLVLYATGALLAVGTLLTLIFEWNNPATLGELSIPAKLQAAFFQSVTLRTAGFATIPQEGFTNASLMTYLVLMFVGGSPSGTAGGVKTVTFVLLCASVFSNIRGHREVTLLSRRVSDETIRRCVAVICFSFGSLLLLTTVLFAVQPVDFGDALYEMTSAIATVGLSEGLTGSLNRAGAFTVMAAMYMGRVGPITIALAFNSKKHLVSARYAEGKAIIG